MQHGRNNPCKVVHGKEHEIVGLVVIAQIDLTQKLSREQIVEIAGEVIHHIEGKLIKRIGADHQQGLAGRAQDETGTGGQPVPYELQH